MKHIKKIIVAIIAIIFIAFLFIYRSYNLKRLEEIKNSNQSATGTQEVVCGDEYRPVCGKNGQTYSNECQATKIGETQVDYTGECEDKITDDNSELTGSGIGENNLGETEETISGTTSETKPEVTQIIPDKKYYENLRSQCSEDSCCLDSVDNMESDNYSEVVNRECPTGYSVDMLKCVNSYKWCRKNNTISNTSSILNIGNSGSTNIGSGTINGKKTQSYFNSNLNYGFSLPYSTYYSTYGSQNGSTHSVGISFNSGTTTYSDSDVKVLFYKNKILDELKDSTYGMYQDKNSGMTYINLNGNSIIVDGGKNKDIVDMIVKSIYVK